MTSPRHKITLTPLYGILVTERSYLLATRREATRKHVTSLAHRVLFPRLPIELVEQVADELVLLREQDARHICKSMRKDPAARYEKFEAGSESTGRLHSSGMRAMSVRVNMPGVDVPAVRYMHLSMGAEQPGVEMLVPETKVATSGGPAMRYGNDMVQVSCRPDSGEEPSSIVTEFPGGLGEPVKERVNTLLLLDGVEEAMKAWDAEVVKKLVADWKLKAVALNEESGLELKPRLRMMQVVSWE